MPFEPRALVICTSSNNKQSVVRRPVMAWSIELFLFLIVGTVIDDCCNKISSTESYPLKSCFNFLSTESYPLKSCFNFLRNIVLGCVLRNLGFVKKMICQTHGETLP